jgi:hypothetical protein
LGAIVVAVLAFWMWKTTEETRAIRHLPAAERQTLYDRTLRTLQSPCRPGDDSRGLRGFCVDQAKFILKFPECDAACRTIASEYLRNPAR